MTQADPPPPPLLLRPLEARDHAALRRIRAEPDVQAWWDEPTDEFLAPDADSTRLTLEIAGAVAGYLEFYEEPMPKYRHATIDLFIDPALRGRGIGAEAVRLAVCHLVDRHGHHRVTIDPAAENRAAVAAYAKVGFRPVGTLRAYERTTSGDWRDGLLMELLAGEERREPLYAGGGSVTCPAEAEH